MFGEILQATIYVRDLQDEGELFTVGSEQIVAGSKITTTDWLWIINGWKWTISGWLWTISGE